MALDGQVCFHGWLFANAVKLCWCIMGSVGPMGSTNQNWLCVRLLPMAVSVYLVVCVRTFLLSAGNTALLSVAQWQGEPAFGLPTPPPPPSHHPLPPTNPPTTTHRPPTHPLISDTHDITVVIKNYLKNQQ